MVDAVRHGFSTREIAARRGVSVDAVKFRAYDELTARGVEFSGAPHMIHRHESGVEEWMAFFDDPDGHPLAIMCQAGG